MQPRWKASLHHDSHAFLETGADGLSTRGAKRESLATIMHDARNMVTALEFYCEMLAAPDVLGPAHRHYRDQLQLLASMGRRLVGRLAALENNNRIPTSAPQAALGSVRSPILSAGSPRPQHPVPRCQDMLPDHGIGNLAAQLLANRDLLATLAGPAIRLTMDVQDAELPVRMTGEDLTRVLINLVKNSIEAMPQGGHIHLALRENRNRLSACRWLMLTVEDNGTGIPLVALGKIFNPGYTTRSPQPSTPDSLAGERGWGLSITRSIVKAAGGRIHAANREPSGACFEIELPVGNR